MIQEITKYPAPTSNKFAAPVRVVDEEILTIIQDLKDTINENSIKALTAYQIGSPYNIIVIKQDDETFLELLNPILMKRDGEQTTLETTAYFGELSAKVKRADKISVLYEDIGMNSCSLKAEGEFSALLQRKIDYTYGSSFINKLDKEEKKLFESRLEFGSDISQSEACPTTFKRDYITKLSDILMLVMILLLGVSFFTADEMADTMWDYQTYLAASVFLLSLIYFFYAQYEGRKYSSCSSCQIGNILGTIAITLTRTSVILLLSYFLI